MLDHIRLEWQHSIRTKLCVCVEMKQKLCFFLFICLILRKCTRMGKDCSRECRSICVCLLSVFQVENEPQKKPSETFFPRYFTLTQTRTHTHVRTPTALAPKKPFDSYRLLWIVPLFLSVGLFSVSYFISYLFTNLFHSPPCMFFFVLQFN